MPFSVDVFQQLLDTWGYFAVFLFVMVESSGIPVPGETMLVIASLYAASGHIGIQWVIAGAAAGAILGDNLGYLAGREGGYRLLRRYGKYLHLDDKRLAWAERFYQRHGDKTVFFGRFVAVLRAWAAFLAGVNHMPWPRFLLFNAAGGIVWAVAYGVVAFKLAENLPLLHQVLRDWGIASIFLAAITLFTVIFIWRHR